MRELSHSHNLQSSPHTISLLTRTYAIVAHTIPITQMKQRAPRNATLIKVNSVFEAMKSPRSTEFYLALTILLITAVLMAMTYFRWLPLNFRIGPFRFTHLLTLIGTFLIAILTPMFYILRRRYPQRNASLTSIHVFSNLFSFILVSIHFAQQMSRSVHPEDNTGLATFILVFILVVTGFLHKFQLLEKGRLYPPHRNRYLHVSLTTAFYIVVIIHTLHNFGVLPLVISYV